MKGFNMINIIVSSVVLVICIIFLTYEFTQRKKKDNHWAQVTKELLSDFHFTMTYVTARIEELENESYNHTVRVFKAFSKLHGAHLGEFPFARYLKHLDTVNSFLAPFVIDTVNELKWADDEKFIELLELHSETLKKSVEQSILEYNQFCTKHFAEKLPKKNVPMNDHAFSKPFKITFHNVISMGNPLLITYVFADIVGFEDKVIIGGLIGVVILEAIYLGYMYFRNRNHKKILDMEIQRDKEIADTIFGSVKELADELRELSKFDQAKIQDFMVNIVEWENYFKTRSYQVQDHYVEIVADEYVELHDNLRKVLQALRSHVSIEYPPMRELIDVTTIELDRQFRTLPSLLLVK